MNHAIATYQVTPLYDEFHSLHTEQKRLAEAVKIMHDTPLYSRCSFTATPGQIILFFFRSHHFRTYFLYMIRYRNISRTTRSRPHDPLRLPTPAQHLGVATPQPPGLTPLARLIASLQTVDALADGPLD